MENNNESLYLFSDEDGNEIAFELVGTLKVNDTEYALLRPEDAEEDEVAIFRILEEDGEEVLSVVEDEDEINTVLEVYEELAEEQSGPTIRS